jgi:ribonuclease-3
MDSILGQRIDFENKTLLQQALTHRSANKNNNERLEFLGDSVLGFVIAKWLYSTYPHLSEGKLTRMRSGLVKGETLAEVARHNKLGDDLILGIGELKSGGFNRASVLADAVEAVFGAVLLDKGFDEVERFILAVLQPWLQKVDPNISDKDAKTRLQEYLQQKGMKAPNYVLLSTQGKDHLMTFTMECIIEELNVITKAVHRSRKKAEQQAAQLVLNKIEKS